MRIIVSGKNVEVTDGLRNSIESKLAKLEKYFNKEVEAKATLTVEKSRQIIEVTIPINGSILRAEETTEDMYTSIDKVVDKLTRQLRKHKTKMENRNTKFDTIRFENIPYLNDDESSSQSKIVKTKRFPLKPMNAEEAVLQMELIGHSFFVYTNGDTEEINVVYKRKDGNYGLIEPDFE